MIHPNFLVREGAHSPFTKTHCPLQMKKFGTFEKINALQRDAALMHSSKNGVGLLVAYDAYALHLCVCSVGRVS
jgi:hypothetical protein